MAGPWEEYQQKASGPERGPWLDYSGDGGRTLANLVTGDKPKPNVAIDMLRAIPGGLAKGATGVVGLPGDLRDLAIRGQEWIAEKTGLASPEAIAQQRAVREADRAGWDMPTSGSLNKQVSAPFGGYYKPQTVPGQYAETAASFAPAALSPGSAVQRIARVAVPAASSETAGQLTKGSKYEPIARAAGALAGGLAQGIGEGLMAHRAAAKTVMSAEELAKAKQAAYDAAKQANVVISPDSFGKFATNLGSEITKNNVVQADVHKNALAALNIVQDEAAAGVPLTLERADLIRQAVNGAIESAASNNSKDLSMAMKVKNALDDYLDKLSPTDTLSGDAGIAVPILKEARSLAQREFKATEIQKLIDLAENSAGSNYSASGMEQALRVQFKNLNARLIKDPSLAKSFTQAERDAITKVVQGGKLENGLRLLGKLAPTNNISVAAGSGIGAGLGFALGGPAGAGAGAAALPIAAGLARSGASALTKNNAQNALLMMRAAPATQSLLSQTPRIPESLLPALLSQSGNR